MSTFSRTKYETLIYSLADQYNEIVSSTLQLYPNSRTTGIVRGNIVFKNDLELRAFEYIDLSDGEIFEYSYTVFRGEEKIRWYDPQPHPENQALAETFPHHFHEGPNIKHNRKAAPGINFEVPNIPTLIADCVKLVEGKK